MPFRWFLLFLLRVGGHIGGGLGLHAGLAQETEVAEPFNKALPPGAVGDGVPIFRAHAMAAALSSRTNVGMMITDRPMSNVDNFGVSTAVMVSRNTSGGNARRMSTTNDEPRSVQPRR